MPRLVRAATWHAKCELTHTRTGRRIFITCIADPSQGWGNPQRRPRVPSAPQHPLGMGQLDMSHIQHEVCTACKKSSKKA